MPQEKKKIVTGKVEPVIEERLWFNSHNLVAVVPRSVLGSSWWPVHINRTSDLRAEEIERVIASHNGATEAAGAARVSSSSAAAME